VICARCQGSIKADEEYETHDNPGASAAGSFVYLHKELCRKTPQQTYPVPSRRKKRF
jgi:hypothetical protein